ncbi:MAG TPA: cyclic-phosphate processing receiver domain-containing protein [Anaerovoracaceae bacterium]|nr:cyclic-phosphate processing receiver domain-containing protein [Anaerovoracaceae bacterium]
MDDERPNPDPNRYHSFMAAPDLIATLQKHGNDLSGVTLHLDHDLGICRECSDACINLQGCPHRGNGYDVLVWVEEQVVTNPEFLPPMIKIHTANAAARPKMVAAAKFIATYKMRE